MTLAKQTAPDRKKFKLRQSPMDMSEDELSEVYKKLNVGMGVLTSKMKERYISDPPLSQQNYCLHSFVPCKGAKPDKDGVYGWIKCRGTFNTQNEMNEQSEVIVRNVDSFHHIFHSKVGQPFPFTLDPRYVEDTVEIDVKKKMKKDISNSVKSIRDEEKKTLNQLKEGEEKLLEDVSEDKVVDELDTYITNRVKRATLIFTLVKTREKMNTMIKNLKNVEAIINKADADNSTFKDGCMKRYSEAQKRAGINVDETSSDNMVHYIMSRLPDGIMSF